MRSPKGGGLCSQPHPVSWPGCSPCDLDENTEWSGIYDGPQLNLCG